MELYKDKNETSEGVKESPSNNSIFENVPPVYPELQRVIKCVQWVRFLLSKKDREGVAGDLIEMSHTMRGEKIALWWIWVCVVIQMSGSIVSNVPFIKKLTGLFDKKDEKEVDR